jgi:hypothetical protein
VPDDKPPRRTWINRQAEVFVQELSDLGLTMTHRQAADLIRERREAVATAMRISPRAAQYYIDDDMTRGIARDLAFSIADEQPGLDVMTADRTAEVPINRVGRTVSALAECALIDMATPDPDAAEKRLHYLSTLGIMTTEATRTALDGVVRLPPALINRIARSLELTAELLATQGHPDSEISQPSVEAAAAALRRDAEALRGCAAS